VHNHHRGEDPLIEELLNGSLSIYSDLEDHVGKAKVLNALGTLRMKSKRYADAESYMRQMIELRERHLPKDDPDHGQGHMTLGSLFHEIGRHDEGVEQMKMALNAYVTAYHEMHPKVANAHEGVAKLYMEMGNLTAAQQHIDAAIGVRKHAQSKSDGHQLFADKIDELERKAVEVKKTKTARTKLMWKKGLGAKLSISAAAVALQPAMISIKSVEPAPSAAEVTSTSSCEGGSTDQPAPQQQEAV
jgi:tetratricopeptide (TPR) repeat protein